MLFPPFHLFNGSGQLRADEMNRLARAVETLGRPSLTSGQMAANPGGVAIAPPTSSGGGPTVTAQYLQSISFQTFGPVVHTGGQPGSSDLGMVLMNTPGIPLAAGTNLVLMSVVLTSQTAGNLQWDVFMGLATPAGFVATPDNIQAAQILVNRWPAFASFTLTTYAVTYVGVVTGQPAGTYYPVLWMEQSDDHTNTAPDSLVIRYYPQSWAVLSF